VLDVGCGERPLGIGLDVIAGSGHVRGRAQAMPFADGCFDTVVSHLGLDVMTDLDRVLREIVRVLAPGGTFAAIVGGGPVAHGDDAYHALGRLLPAKTLGDRRVRDERTYRAYFSHVSCERIELHYRGWSIVWPTLSALACDDSCRDALFDQVGDACEARVVTWLIRCAGSA